MGESVGRGSEGVTSGAGVVSAGGSFGVLTGSEPVVSGRISALFDIPGDLGLARSSGSTLSSTSGDPFPLSKEIAAAQEAEAILDRVARRRGWGWRDCI